MQSMEVQFLWNYKKSFLGSRNKLNTYVVSAGFCGFAKTTDFECFEWGLCVLQNSNPIFSLVVFDQQGEKKEHLNIDEDIKITVCTCWQ